MFMAFHSGAERKRILVWAALSLLLLGIGIRLSFTR
jgi:hypothetical protein